MLFNSVEFALFLPLVFLLYWFVFNRNIKLQNLYLVAVSYLFYGLWDWRFLFLIAFVTVSSFLSGLLIQRELDEGGGHAKAYSIINIILLIGVLGFFKYFNFFVDQFVALLSLFNVRLNVSTLNIILPVGISFYTFQALSYSLDVYHRKINATKDIVSFFAFIGFFPQLLAGPIGRAPKLLPQFITARKFDYNQAVDGCKLLLWGLFKKVVIADTCALYVDEVFADIHGYSSSTLLIAAILYSFQIYGDFSGYSDAAIGVAKLFGISLMRNFHFPYFSRNVAEFWRRWHISLNRWFVDYIYIPLGGSREGKWKSFRNTLIIFSLCGFWHGANWTFIVWGIYHALWFLPLLLLDKNKENKGTVVAQDRKLPSTRELLQILSTFFIAMFGWVIFRSENIDQAFDYVCSIFTPTIAAPVINISILIQALFYIVIMLLVEWVERGEDHGLTLRYISNKYLRLAIYVGLMFIVIVNFRQGQTFIYFQF